MRTKPASQQAFTLIEVMVAMVLAGILVLGVMGLFATVEEASYDLLLRQKAVFLLNGEMERLYALHQNSSFAMTYPGDVITASPAANYTDPPNRPHWVYRDPTGATGTSCPPTRQFSGSCGSVIALSPNNFTEAASESGILYYDAGANPPVNVVWLDQEKKITAQLSWTADAIGNHLCYERSTGSLGYGNCYVITMYLDYPFRFNTTSNTPLEAMGPVKTETLRTIIGNRKSSP